MEQEQAILAVLEKEDVFAVLSTSFGKSPIYQSYFVAKSVIDADALKYASRDCFLPKKQVRN